MSKEYDLIWNCAAIILGFQATSFSWRIKREVAFAENGRQSWLPPSELINLVSMLASVVGVFLLPILGVVGPEFARISFGFAMVLFIGYPFALAGHYQLLKLEMIGNRSYFPVQERFAVLASILIALLFIILAFIRSG